MTKNYFLLLGAMLTLAFSISKTAQAGNICKTAENDTITQDKNGLCNENKDQEAGPKASRLQLSGIGEAIYTHHLRHKKAATSIPEDGIMPDGSQGSFSIPSVAIALEYDFGKGWTMASELEFVYDGKETVHTGQAIETRHSSEIILSEFFLQKAFSQKLNVRAGYFAVPVGYTNAFDEPEDFFTVGCPQGESTLMPSTWKQTGLSLWGETGDWRYEMQLHAGLDAGAFCQEGFISGGVTSPYEFSTAARPAIALRADNSSISGLRIGISGYFGQSVLRNRDEATGGLRKARGNITIGALDFTYDDSRLLVRGYADYCRLSNTSGINSLLPAAREGSPVGKNAITCGAEVGYDILKLNSKHWKTDQYLYIFGRYDYYNSCLSADPTSLLAANNTALTKASVVSAGVNYKPVSDVILKAVFSQTLPGSGHRDVPVLSVGIAYSGLFAD